MTPNEYQKEASKTIPSNYFNLNSRADKDALLNAALGLCGESGEFADILKKHCYQGHPLDTNHLAKELGDILWYVSLGASGLGLSLETIMRMNINKLRKRYPEEHFDPEKSLQRLEGDI